MTAITSRTTDLSNMSDSNTFIAPPELRYIQYHGSKESTYLSAIRQLISKDLSEPYSIYVYRYFLYQWGDLCFMVSFSLPQRVPVLTHSYSHLTPGIG